MLAGECYLKRSSPLSSRCLVGRTDWCFSLRNFRSEMIQHWFYLPLFHDRVKGSKRWCQKQKIAKMHRFPQWGYSCWYQHSLLFQLQVLLKLRFVDKAVILWQNHSPHLVSGKSWNDAGAAIEADEQMYLFAHFPMHHRRWMWEFCGVSQTKDHMFCHWSFLKSQYPQQVGWRDSAWPLFAKSCKFQRFGGITTPWIWSDILSQCKLS